MQRGRTHPLQQFAKGLAIRKIRTGSAAHSRRTQSDSPVLLRSCGGSPDDNGILRSVPPEERVESREQRHKERSALILAHQLQPTGDIVA
jgi:hypothetical protein